MPVVLMVFGCVAEGVLRQLVSLVLVRGWLGTEVATDRMGTTAIDSYTLSRQLMGRVKAEKGTWLLCGGGLRRRLVVAVALVQCMPCSVVCGAGQNIRCGDVLCKAGPVVVSGAMLCMLQTRDVVYFLLPPPQVVFCFHSVGCMDGWLGLFKRLC
jgi:hypothetical protein